jgi:hypothetical protein
MYSPINPEAYLRIRAEETRRMMQRAEFRAIRRRRLAKDYHRDH